MAFSTSAELQAGPAASILRFTPEALACVKRSVERVNCSTLSGVYAAGDIATGAVSNCALPLVEPNRTRKAVTLLQPSNAVTNVTVIPLVSAISNMMGYPLKVDVVDSRLWTREPLREFEEEGPNGLRDAWFLDPVLTADMADEPVGGLLDMSELVLQDQNLNWNGFGTFFRAFASVYDGKVVGLPVSAAIMLFYYRRDIFAQHNISVPATWEEVLEVAERWNGTDVDGSGRGKWGFCMPRQPGCYNGYTFQAIQVPHLQAQGSSEGFHFDHANMRPLVDSKATQYAAGLYRRLARYTAPTEQVGCLPVSLSFVTGDCLMAVGSTLHFKYAMFHNGTVVRGRTGTAVLPGSQSVLDRGTGRMAPCSQDTCPHGRQHTLANGSQLWINTSPYAGRGAFTYAINARSPPEQQLAAYRICARRAYADYMWPSPCCLAPRPAALPPLTETTPVRKEMMDPANLYRYTSSRPPYEGNDTLLFLKAVRDTVEHVNIALNLRISGAIDYYLAVDAAAVALTDSSQPVDQILAAAQAAVERVYANRSTEWLRQRYYKSIERRLPVPPPPPALAEGPSLNQQAKVAIGVGAGVGGAIILCGAAALVWGSTVLWEALPGDQMQAALQTHDAATRRMLAKHGGYESATEVLPLPVVAAAGHTAGRGLRVRAGLHSGVGSAELAQNRASARVTFSGTCIRLAKAVADSACLHSAALAPRLLLQPAALRVRRQLLRGVLAAPAGCVALVRLHIAGLGLLRATEPALAAEVTCVLESLLLETLPALGGYLSEARDGGADGLVAAFPEPLRAVAWALWRRRPWTGHHGRVLQHAIFRVRRGEGAAAAQAAAAGLTSATSKQAQTPAGAVQRQQQGSQQGLVGVSTLFRGPRTKAAVDVGPLGTELCRATGRLLYRGRIAKQRGQVLCTPAVFAAVDGRSAASCGISMAPVQLFRASLGMNVASKQHKREASWVCPLYAATEGWSFAPA
eukprot:XP_001701768.1 predicted protein [Chlamydomonas reinhardtii]